VKDEKKKRREGEDGVLKRSGKIKNLC